MLCLLLELNINTYCVKYHFVIPQIQIQVPHLNNWILLFLMSFDMYF